VTELLPPWARSPVLTWGPLVGLTAFFFAALAVFAIRTALQGRARSDRVAQVGGSPLLSEFFMEYGLWMFRPFANTFIRWGLHPDVLSWSSLVLHLLAAFAVAAGAFGLGGWILLFGAAADSLDGAVARGRGMASDSGEVLDAAIDRVAEMSVFFGYAYYYRDLPVGFLLSGAACIGAVMVSYARAKGEAMGVDAKMGFMQRHERAAYLISATILSSILGLVWRSPEAAKHHLVLAALAVMALFSNWTGVQRIAFIRRELGKR
jgi:CDP-diacylglycerol--glycerol-3-phosphate 3-phosphatidyltransferase